MALGHKNIQDTHQCGFGLPQRQDVRKRNLRQSLTTKDQLEILEMRRIGNNGIRDRGTGRPTKKERREIDGFLMNAGMDDFNYPGSPDTEENEGEGAFDENGYDSIFDEI